MEFFDINYCRALIESNKSEDIELKIKEINKSNNKYINDLLMAELKLKFEKLENIKIYKTDNLIIIKHLIERFLIIKEINLTSNNLLQFKQVGTNFNEIINNTTNFLIEKNNSKLAISKLQKLFNFKINNKNRYVFYSYYNDLKNQIIHMHNAERNEKNEYIYNIKMVLYKISQIDVRNKLLLEFNLFLIDKNKLKLDIKKKNIQLNKLKSNINKNIKLCVKKQNNFIIKIKKSHLRSLIIIKLIKTNTIVINKFKQHLNIIKQNINNTMNKNYNKCKKFNKNDDIICTICLEKIEDGIITSCNHSFHLECINLYVYNIIHTQIINIICPMCRAHI
jgi:hypothetical protein